ncbi:MAG: hypothetical protein AAGC72_16845 [Planctomycetota bacterium]
MISLTQYQSNLPLAIDPEIIVEVVGLDAYHDDLCGFEGGQRTRITTRYGMIHLVNESVQEVLALKGPTKQTTSD